MIQLLNDLANTVSSTPIRNLVFLGVWQLIVDAITAKLLKKKNGYAQTISIILIALFGAGGIKNITDKEHVKKPKWDKPLFHITRKISIATTSSFVILMVLTILFKVLSVLFSFIFGGIIIYSVFGMIFFFGILALLTFIL